MKRFLNNMALFFLTVRWFLLVLSLSCFAALSIAGIVGGIYAIAALNLPLLMMWAGCFVIGGLFSNGLADTAYAMEKRIEMGRKAMRLAAV